MSFPNKTESVHAKMNIAQQDILHASQGRGFGGVVGLEFAVQAEAGAIGRTQDLVYRVSLRLCAIIRQSKHLQLRKSPCSHGH